MHCRHYHPQVWAALAAAWMVAVYGCASSVGPTSAPIDRLTTIPADVVKMTPETDLNPVRWFNRDYFVWRSRLIDGQWQAPEKMFGPLAGEPSLDVAGNIYFTHHYYDGDTLLEADIYVSHHAGS